MSDNRTVRNSDAIIFGLDIGTSKIAAIVGKVKSTGAIEVIGLGVQPSKGLEKGVVVNINATVEAIQKAIEEAESQSGYRASSVYVGIAGKHINSYNLSGKVSVKNGEIQQEDVDRVIENATAFSYPASDKILHVLQQDFSIDGESNIREPIGMSGDTLVARVHVITCAISAEKNIIKSIEQCGLKTEAVILEQLASSESILSEDEKELGICLVDIGAGTTDIAVFKGNAIRFTKVIPVGGNHVTNDIAEYITTPKRDAEIIKREHGCVIESFINGDEKMNVPSVGNRPARLLSKKSLVDVVALRYREIFELVLEQLKENGYGSLPAGVVLTGGSSLVDGAALLAEETMDMAVRIGIPPEIKGAFTDDINNPQYATTLGLLYFVRNQLNVQELITEEVLPETISHQSVEVKKPANSKKNIKDKVLNFLKKY